MTTYHWQDLLVWKRAHALALSIYKLTSTFPDAEKYNLTSQIRRSVISIPTNIVEGHGRNTEKEFLHFLYISRGSLEETRYLILLAQELDFFDVNLYAENEKLASEVSILINKLIKSLSGKPSLH